MDEGQDGASAQGHQSMDQLQQEIHAKDLLLEALRYENNNLKQYGDRHYDQASTPDRKSYDALKRKVVEYQKALEQRDQIIGQLEAGIKQLMHQNMESEAKCRKAEEHYSIEIQTLAQQVQKLTAQLTITSQQHQAAMRAAQDHFTQQLAASQQQMRDKHEGESATLREKHASEMAAVTLQAEAVENSQREEHHQLVEHLTHLSNSLGAQLEEEKEKFLGFQREKEEWEVLKKELEAESEERESLRRSLDEQMGATEELQERLKKQVERQMQEEGKVKSLREVVASMSQNLNVEMEQRKIIEAKQEQEILNARKYFEQKTALEVNQKQLALQLHVAEEELANTAASKVSDLEKLESIHQEKEAFIQENEALTKVKDALTKENKGLTSKIEFLGKDKELLLSVKLMLTKEKDDLTSKNELLTKEKEMYTSQSEALTKEKETLTSEYRMLTKEKEALALENSRIVADIRLKQKDEEHLVKEVEVLTKMKDSLIIERDSLLKAKNDSLMEKDLWTRERETLLTETEAWATEKEHLLTEKESLLLENKNFISEKEALVNEDAALKRQLESLSLEKEVAAKDKERLTVQVEDLMSEKSILLKGNDDLVSEKHMWIKERETLLQKSEAWDKEKDDLLSEKQFLLSENKIFMTEKETWEKEKEDLAHQIDVYCTEKSGWSQKEESLNKKNEVLTEQSKCLVNEKEHLIQANISLSDEKEMLIREKESLMKQVQNSTAEKENFVQLTEEFTKKNVELVTEKETLTCQINILQREKEAAAHNEDQVSGKALEEVRSLREELEIRHVEKQHLEEKCGYKEAEVKELQEKYNQSLALKESDLKELEESYKKELLSKELEIRGLEENFKETLSLKEKEIRELEEKDGNINLQKDCELKKLTEKIASKESELQELKRKDRGMEELHANCLRLLQNLQSGEEERKKIEEECEDKCEVLNNVLRNVDVKLCEAASLLSRQMVQAEDEVEGAESRRNHREKGHSEAHTEKETLASNLRKGATASTSMAGDRGEEENKEEESCEQVEEVDHVKGRLGVSKGNEEDLVEKLTLSEKEKKQLANEAEIMRNKIHDQRFTITSLQNEKSRLGQHIIQLEREKSSLKAEEILHVKDNLNTQEELSDLKAKVTAQKQKLELQEKEMNKINQALTVLTQEGIVCPEKLRDNLISLKFLSSKFESFKNSEDVDDPLWMSVLRQELEALWKHHHTTFGCMIDLQQHTDSLHQEKLQTDLENISMSAELECLRLNSTCDDSGRKDSKEGNTCEEKEGREIEDSILKCMREENKMLKQCLDNKSLLLRVERLHLLSPRPNFERELNLCLRERKVVVQVVRTWLERFVSQWKLQAETHPSLHIFTEALATYTEDLSGHLLGLSSGDDMSAEFVVRCLQQTMIKGVSQEYQEAISATLDTLEEDLNRTLRHITLPASLLDTSQKPASSLKGDSLLEPTQKTPSSQEDDTQQDSLSSLQRESSFDPPTLSQDLTAKVEHLINVRTALVDAANEFNEELEEVLGQRLVLLREQLQSVVKDGEPDVKKGRSCLPSLPQHQEFIQEFTDFTSRVSQEAYTEKLQVLRNQQEMVHKILEDNQAKLGAVCRGFLQSLHGLTSVEEMKGKGKALVDSLESTLAKEAAWVEKQYRDLLEHYTREQDSNKQAHTTTCSYLVHTLTLLLQCTEIKTIPSALSQEHTAEVEQLQEKHEEAIQRLEAQLAAKDQETLQHLQGLYSDRDWYKKTVGLLSRVTLQLLHYYSVAQNLTHQDQQDSTSPPPHPPESPAPGKVLDLSFLSDCVGEEEEEMLAFSEDGVLATGLMGRTALGLEGEGEDIESVLDGTAVSEGMMEDLDKDEQVRTLLERSYPQLMAILKGRWDRVEVARLEKEIQELTISLQASAGMLRIFIHSVSNYRSDLPPHTQKDEVQEDSDKNFVREAGHSEPSQENNDLNKESGVIPAAVQLNAATEGAAVAPSASILQQDLSCISEGLMQLLAQESLPNFTQLVPHDLQDKEQLRAALHHLCEAAQATANLKLDLHHAQSLQQGLEEERHNLQEEVTRLTHYSKNLARELQVLKDQLEEADQENQRPVSQYAAKMEATKDVRERVRAALSAKNVADMERGQLEARVRELEGLLEVVVRESEVALEALRIRETDLSQQLEVADRQLKSARQFLEEHASERDQEVEELVAARDKLSQQLREREAQLSHQAVREKEICDLREIIQSLESQVDSHCLKEAELTEQVEELVAALTLAQQQVQHLSAKVEELRPEGGRQDGQRTDETVPAASGEDKAEGNIYQHNASLLSELQEDVLSTSVLFQLIEKRLRDTTRGLEAMQLSGSAEDICAQDVEVTVAGTDGRLSPGTVDRRLEDQLLALECTTEAAIKRNRDLQLTIKNLQAEYEDVSAERDTLQERSRDQLVKISGLESRLDEVRRADHPAAADMRQRVALLQGNLEEKRSELTKKSREAEQLKHSLGSLREQLTNRQEEVEQLQSASLAQPQSFPQTTQDHLAASHAHLEEDLAHKSQLLESLQKELKEFRQSSSFSPSLAEDLISEKNAEISELNSKVKILLCAIQKVYVLLKEGRNLYEAWQILSHVLGRECGEALNESEEQEVLRREEPEQIPGLVLHDSVKEAALLQVSPVPLQKYNEQEEDSVHTQPSDADLSLMSGQTVPPPELLQVSQLTEVEQQGSRPTSVSECTSSELQSQAHLEEDFRSAQEVLEAREAEILQLSEEVEDASPSPLAPHPALDLREMSSRLKAYEEHVDHLSLSLQRKSEEVQQLATQLERVHAEMRERLSEASREAGQLQHKLQQEISDLKEQHIAQEKKLCRDYEEHMVRQVEDVAQHMNRNKEAAMARQQEVFEAALRQAAVERDEARRQLDEWCAASPSPPPQTAPQAHPSDNQTAAQLCASVDTLIAGLKQELEKSGQLDLSMASLVRGRESGEASTRASSTFSDVSDGEEPTSINGKMQHLMNKIHKEGIEVLSLIDIMFLCKHRTQLDPSQRSFITTTSLLASSFLERGGAEEQASLMRNLAAVEEELTKKEQEMKRKIGVLELQLEQEKMSGSEWRLSFESERQHTQDLLEQLRKERLLVAEQVSELTLLRSQLLIIRLHDQKLQEENCSLSECQEKKDKRIESLQAALQTERNNFSRMSKVLSEERKVSGLTHSEQEAIIKDLRNSLEKERERIVALCSHLERMTSQQSTQLPTTATPTRIAHLKKSDPSRPTIEELQIQLAVAKDHCGERERACERERLQAVCQREQATAERARFKVDVRKAEGKLAELTRTVRSLEIEKQRLVRQMSHEKERLQHQDSRIKELEGEVRRLETDSKAQSEAHLAMSDRMREEGTQLHLAYTRTLTKLGEVEAEVCELRHKFRTVDKELQLARKQEEQLKQDLHTERTAVDRSSLPAVFRIMNPDGGSDLHLKGNLELCRAMLRLTDDQRAMRVQIAELEDTVTSRDQQLLQAQATNKKNFNFEEKLKAERRVWETERASLRHVNHHVVEAGRLRAERDSQQNTPGVAEMQQLYGRYLQSEHWRKALVWQKQYLMLVIQGYSDTEQHTLARLTAMAPPHAFPSSTLHPKASHFKERFRVAVLVVVALCRMKNLVVRFHRKKRLCLEALAATHTTPSTPEISRPQSRISVARAREARPTTPQAPREPREGAWCVSFTGLTPPTREPGRSITPRIPSVTHRSLFQEDSEELNQYVERLDNIHSVLGLTHKKQ